MKVIIDAAELIKDELWFVPYMTRNLVSFNIHTKEIKVHSNINLEGTSYRNYIISMAKYKDFLLALPKLGQKLYIYNTLNDEMKVISVCDSKYGDIEKDAYVSMYVCGEKLYLFGYAYKGIGVYDFNSEELFFLNPFEKMPKSNNQWGYFGKQAFECNKKIYVPFASMDGWIEINTITGQIKSNILNDALEEGYSAIAIKDDYLYAVPRFSGSLLKYDLRSKSYEKKKIVSETIRSFCAISAAENVVAYKDDIPFVTDLYEWNEVLINSENYEFVKIGNDYQIFFDIDSHLKIVIDKEEYNIDLSNVGKRINLGNWDIPDIMKEGRVFRLQEYIERISR